MLQLHQQATDATTPILDSGVLPPTHRRGIRPKALFAGLLIGVLAMEALALFVGQREEHWPAIFLFLVLLSVAVHEFGHLLAGWAVGFEFSSIHIGPLHFEIDFGTGLRMLAVCTRSCGQ